MDPNGNGNRRDNNGWNWAGVAAGLTGVAALAGGLYYMSRRNNQQEEEPQPYLSPTTGISLESGGETSLTRLINGLSVSPQGAQASGSPNPNINNLNALLADIYDRHIAIDDEQFSFYYKIFTNVLYKVHQTMKDVDPYYNRYSSTLQFAGSHSDRLRIDKPSEFDMDIVIGLPLNLKVDQFFPDNSDINIEPASPGFVQLRMGTQYKNLPMRDGASWEINKAAYKWKDDDNYLLRSKFIDWFKSVVVKALNTFETDYLRRPKMTIDGRDYSISRTESGPAITLNVTDSWGFRLDFDLVPCLKLPEERWPVSAGYREIPAQCKKDFWLVVPKPHKGTGGWDRSRSWRIALNDQERQLLYDTNNLRQAIRLMKKLRDAQGMNHIASYYIKTLFFLDIIDRNDKYFYSYNNPTTIFKIMVKKLHEAVVKGEIPYLWNRNNNLIENVHSQVLRGYVVKLEKLLKVLDQPSEYKQVARYLLSDAEYNAYSVRLASSHI